MEAEKRRTERKWLRITTEGHYIVRDGKIIADSSSHVKTVSVEEFNPKSENQDQA